MAAQGAMWFIPILILLLPLFLVIYLIYRWVKTSFSLRKEQNEILREIVKKLEKE